MTASLIAGCVWVFAGVVTAMLPMRRQMVPGLTLLVTAPVILVWIGAQNGWVWTILGILAFGSMMRNPLRYLFAKMRGDAPEQPKELRE